MEVKPTTGTTHVHLVLTAKEADALLSITRSVSGDPEASPRGVFDDLRHKLSEALGVQYGNTVAHHLLGNSTYIYFGDYV